MSLQIEATYENGILKPDKELPLENGQRVKLTVENTEGAAKRLLGLIQWKGSQEDLKYLAESDDNHPWSLASLDADFDRVPGISRYAPA